MRRQHDRPHLPLGNVTVIEVSTNEPCAFCACQLGDLGAEVLRMEIPGKAPDYPKQVWDMANRNKKSFYLNAEARERQDVIEEIVRNADIFLEDQAPGTLRGLGLDYDSVKEINPGVVYCSISSYGQTGPYRMLPGDEICAQALGGMLLLKDNTLGNIGNPETGQPHVPDIMVAETKAAFHAAVGVLAALLARRRTGQGQYVELSLLDGVVSQKAAKPMTDLKKAANGFQIYETKDKKFLVSAAIEPWTWKNFVKALGKEDLADVSLQGEHEHLEVLKILRSTFKNKTRREWLDLFQDIGTELSPVNTHEEAVIDPQMVERETFAEAESSDGKRSIQYSTPMKFSALPWNIRRAAPALGQDTEAVLSQMFFTKKR